MKPANSMLRRSNVPEAWMRLADALMFGALRTPSTDIYGTYSARTSAPRPPRKWLERLDDWLARQRQREREAYLGEAKDIFDLEQRIRRLERSRYY